MPIVRTFAPIVAGIGKMHYKTFASYNLIGGFVWTFGVPFLGYFLGQVIPDVDKYLLPIILVIVVASVAPSSISTRKADLRELKTNLKLELGLVKPLLHRRDGSRLLNKVRNRMRLEM